MCRDQQEFITMGNNEKHDANRDPISGAPGAHPVGTGVGAAGGAVTGAAVGSVAGPIGTAVGGVVGAVVGGLAGKGIGEAVNPTAEDAYWRENHTKEPYYSAQYKYDDYSPAYRVGYKSRAQYSDRTWDEAEPELRADWERTKGTTRMNWDDAKQATRAAWHRVERALPGDADHDGR
ncbi:MAG: hypothetical protein ABIU96_00045 [Rhodanobacter sp.]